MIHKNHHIHFVGIGGIGMSALARILRLQGYRISGCDTSSGAITKQLEKLGCAFFEGHDERHVHDADVVVHSTAIAKENPDLDYARKNQIPLLHRAQLLAHLMNKTENIAITGTHGKTTTTALIAHMLIEAKKDPTVVAGGIIKNIGSNARIGKSQLFVAEADESDRSLLLLPARYSIVTNIDLDHLETYDDIDDIKQTCTTFLNQLPPKGKAILCHDDPHCQDIMPRLSIPMTTFGLQPGATIQGSIVSLQNNASVFEVFESNNLLGTIKLPMPGTHNVLNALAAIALCRELNIPFDLLKNALVTFKGIERRFEFKGTFNGAEIYDDYGHHPVEIAYTIAVARKRAKKRLIVAFEPHRYSRTAKLWHDFVHTLSSCNADMLIMTNIYPASEQAIPGITTHNLIAAIRKKNKNMTIMHAPTYDAIKKKLQEEICCGDLLLTLGAGKLNYVADELASPSTLV